MVFYEAKLVAARRDAQVATFAMMMQTALLTVPNASLKEQSRKDAVRDFKAAISRLFRG